MYMSLDIDMTIVNTIKDRLIKNKNRSISKPLMDDIIKKCNKSTLQHIYLTIPLTSYSKIILLEHVAFED